MSLTPTNFPAFLNQFRTTDRQSLNVCPGFELTYSWPIEVAEQLDRDGEFEEEVRARLGDALGCWDDTLDRVIKSI